MAKSKKARRVRQRPAKSTTGPIAEPQAKETAAAGSTVDHFQQEYAYVIKDLRRVLFLAAAMFILLIVLNLVLR